MPQQGSETTKEEGAGALGHGEREDKSVSGHEQTSAHMNSAPVDASTRPARGLASVDAGGGGAHDVPPLVEELLTDDGLGLGRKS